MTTLTILITGASKGIGLATAKRLAKKGHRLALFDIDTDSLTTISKDKTFAKLNKKHALITGTMDVTNPNDWDNALATTLQSFGNIHVLINNAGVIVSGDLPDTKLTQQLSLIDINCKGVMIGCHKVGKLLQTSPSPYSKIINLSSASAIYGQPEIAPYSASKFFVRGLTEALNLEYEPKGIKVIDVMPLWVKTDLTDGITVTSIDRLGLQLTADDVAKKLAQLSTIPNQDINKVHYPIGLTSHLLYQLADIIPSPMVRVINGRFTSR